RLEIILRPARTMAHASHRNHPCRFPRTECPNRRGSHRRWHTDAMAPWRVRDFHFDDLDAAVRLWDTPAASSEAPAFGLSDLIAAVRSHEPAVVAVVGEELAGVAVATVTGDEAWVMRISLAAAWRRRGIGSAMLGELERRL